MELINPYAVMRNTATYEAYRAHGRKAARAGQPFLAIGFLLALLVPQVFFATSHWLLHKSPLDWKWAIVGLILSMALSVIFLGVGVLRVLRFRRENPIPDEWRQIPRSNPLRSPGRKPPLPEQG